MAISHRLHSPMDQRPDEGIEQPLKRIVFLSVEGSKTEKQYFHYINKYRQQLSIDSVIHIEVLTRWSKDTNSDLRHVYELMQEYMEIRNKGILPTDLYEELSHEGISDLTLNKLTDFMYGTLDYKELNRMKDALRLAEIDYDYQKFLSTYKGEDGNDIFAIVIDRDSSSHTEDEIKKMYKLCKKHGWYCFITNPCFEFWLLLHVCDVKQEFCTHYQKLLDNPKISEKHTYVSLELSKRVHHAKSISEKKFIEYYLNSVDTAIERAQLFTTDERNLLYELGSNIPLLFSILRDKTE